MVEKTIKEMTVEERVDLFLHVMKDEMNIPLVSVDFLDWLIGKGFFTAPASANHHLNYEGGLFEHSMNVMEVLLSFTEKGECFWGRKSSPYIIGMFHDLCKIDSYILEADLSPLAQPTWVHNNNCILKGHATKSIMLLSQFVNLTEEELLCIRFHMGAYETNDWDAYDKAIRMFPNVLWTHTADMIASKLMEG